MCVLAREREWEREGSIVKGLEDKPVSLDLTHRASPDYSLNTESYVSPELFSYCSDLDHLLNLDSPSFSHPGNKAVIPMTALVLAAGSTHPLGSAGGQMRGGLGQDWMSEGVFLMSFNPLNQSINKPLYPQPGTPSAFYRLLDSRASGSTGGDIHSSGR